MVPLHARGWGKKMGCHTLNENADMKGVHILVV